MSKILVVLAGLLCLAVPTVLAHAWVTDAKSRLRNTELNVQEESAVAVAKAADEQYCTPELKRILRRVLQSCGLLGSGQVRGCQPLEAKNVATMSGDDFNALFLPMAQRAGIVQFDRDSAQLDGQDIALIDQVFADQKGASYFFIVSRASPEGGTEHNRDLSKTRAEMVMNHLKQAFNDPDLDREVGLLWLGEEFAQLQDQFCSWRRSGTPGMCMPEEINRSAFITWIDCRL
jgi:outer membrane protein OmpA-like peptidoglycan-associated protein